MGSAASKSSPSNTPDPPAKTASAVKPEENEEGKKEEQVATDKAAPIKVIKPGKEEYQKYVSRKEPIVQGRLRENLPEHPLVKNKFFMVRDDATIEDMLNTKEQYGVKNFRQAKGGMAVYGMAQPSKNALHNIIEKLHADGFKDIIAVNLREEPVVFVKEEFDMVSYTPREGEKKITKLIVPPTGQDVEAYEGVICDEIVEFAIDHCDNEFYFYHDIETFKNEPHKVEIEYAEYVAVSEEIYARLQFSMPFYRYVRLPVPKLNAPLEKDIDSLINTFKHIPHYFERNEDKTMAIVFNCYTGLELTTFGMTLGCLLMAHRQGFPSEAKETPNEIDEQAPNFEDTEFMLVQKLMQYLPNGPQVKEEVDIMVEYCSECFDLKSELNECKKKLESIDEKSEIEGHNAQEYYLGKCITHLERFFYLLCFNSYLHHQYDKMFTRSFLQWMQHHAYLYRILSHIDIAERFSSADLITKGVRAMVGDEFKKLDVMNSLKELSVSNFRKVPGLPVYGMAQPCKEGLSKVVEHLTKLGHPMVISFNMREEAVLDCDGSTYSPRNSNDLHKCIPMPGISDSEIQNKELKIKEIIKETGSIEVYNDITEPKVSKQFTDVMTMDEMYENQMNQTPELKYHRIPVSECCAPEEKDFDDLLNAIKDLDAVFNDEDGPAYLFNCRNGKDRSTTGMAIACLISSHLRGFPFGTKVFEVELISVPNAAYTKGEFTIIKRLVRLIPNGPQVKREVDLILDKCSETMTPMHYHMREVIWWTVSKVRQQEALVKRGIKNNKSEGEKKRLKRQSLDYLERYIYLILFNTYLHSERPSRWERPFSTWMTEVAAKVGVYELLDKLGFYEFEADPGPLKTMRRRWDM